MILDAIAVGDGDQTIIDQRTDGGAVQDSRGIIGADRSAGIIEQLGKRAPAQVFDAVFAA